MIGGSIIWSGEFDGLTVPAQPLLLNRNEFSVPITDEQLSRFEERRAGGDATLTLQLWGIAERAPSGPLEAVTSGTFALPFSVPRDRWIEVLDHCGFGKRRIIELPAAPSVGGTWEAASARLEAASRELAAGRSGASLVESRVALERLADALGAGLGIPRQKNPFANYVSMLCAKLEELQGGQKGTRYELIAQLVRSAFGFTSDPPHQGLDRGARDDAELALSTGMALYCYLARQPINVQSTVAAV
jgi:hypothetical protein